MMIGIQKFDQKPVYKIITDGPIKNYLASSIRSITSLLINRETGPRYPRLKISHFTRYLQRKYSSNRESYIRIHPDATVSKDITTPHYQFPASCRPASSPPPPPSKPIPLFSLGLKAWLCRRRPDVEEDTPWALHPQTTSGPFH